MIRAPSWLAASLGACLLVACDVPRGSQAAGQSAGASGDRILVLRRPAGDRIVVFETANAEIHFDRRDWDRYLEDRSRGAGYLHLRERVRRLDRGGPVIRLAADPELAREEALLEKMAADLLYHSAARATVVRKATRGRFQRIRIGTWVHRTSPEAHATGGLEFRSPDGEPFLRGFYWIE